MGTRIHEHAAKGATMTTHETHCPYCMTDTSDGKPSYTHPELGLRYCSAGHARAHVGVADYYMPRGGPSTIRWESGAVPGSMPGSCEPWSGSVDEYVLEDPVPCLNCKEPHDPAEGEFCGNDCEIDYYIDAHSEALAVLRQLVAMQGDDLEVWGRAEDLLKRFNAKD